MNVFDYINNYAQTHSIANYTLKAKFVTLQDITKTLQFSGGIAFFYKLMAEGIIANLSDISKKFLEVDTPTDFWDLSPVVEIVDFSSIQKVSTDFIFTADNTLDFKLYEGTADAMFTTVENFCAQYIYLTPLSTGEAGSNAAGTAKAPEAKGEGDGYDIVKVNVNY